MEGLQVLLRCFEASAGYLRYESSALGTYTLSAAVGITPPGEANLTEDEQARLLAGEVLVYRFPRDVTGPGTQSLSDQGYRSLLLVGLRAGTSVRGITALVFDHKPPKRIARTMELISPLLSTLVHQLHLLDSSYRLREQALQILGLSLEYRDHETQGHTERVASLSTEFGAALGLDEPTLRDLRWGAYLHDAGKIAISDTILLKPAALDSAEWRQMRQHTLIGEDFARNLEFVGPLALGLIRNHHERWDGSGYPDQLVAGEIPFLARVFAFVDVWDALVCERPYKEAWEPQRALAKIESLSGQQFDPSLTPAFVDLMSKTEPRRPRRERKPAE